MTNEARSKWTTIRRVGLGLGAVTLGFVGLVGYAHTPSGRPLLRYLPGMGSTCPVGADVAIDRSDRDAWRRAALAGSAGERTAPSRVALGFRLGESTRTELLSWAERSGVTCTEGHGGATLRCADVPASATEIGTPLDSLSVQLDAGDRIVSIDASRRTDDAGQAARFVASRAAAIETRVGPASVRRGEASAAHLASGPLSQAQVDFRFADLRARVIATSAGAGMFALRESHQVLGDG